MRCLRSPGLLCHSSASNCVSRCNRRAMSLRVCANTRLFLTSPRCCCKRRLNSFVRISLSSRAASAALYSWICLRRSLSFGTFGLSPCNKAGGNRQLVASQAYCFFGDFFAHAANFEDNTSRLDDCNPVVNGTLTLTHAGFGGLESDGFVRKDTDPDFATSLHVAGKGDTGRFYLPGLNPAGFQGLQAILAKGECTAPLGSSFHATAMLPAVLCT